MDYVLFSMFSLVSISFIPLFITIMVKLKANYNRIYKAIRCKLTLVFTVYMIFLAIRLLLFAEIKLFHFIFRTVSIYEAIPVYITEIVITLSLAYVLFSISKVNHEQGSI